MSTFPSLRRRRTARILLLIASMAVAASAQIIPLNGSISDGTVGPLVAGPVYYAMSTVTVPAGSTLTIQSGAIIKFGLDVSFNVDGMLVGGGTAGQPIVFTSDQDDTVGGDTTANGSTVGSPNHWRGLTFGTASTGTLSHAIVRFGGRNFAAGIELFGNTTIAISNTTISDMQQACLDLNGSSTSATISNCAFNTSSRAVEGVRLNALAGFSNNSASGNTGLDSIAVDTGTVTGTASVPSSALVNGVIVLDASINVPVGTTLNVAAGVVFKVRAIDISVLVSGSLNCMGTAGQQVIFTDFNDDSVGGDTNKNGPSSTSANHWRGLDFSGAAVSTLTHTVVRGGGRNFTAGIEVSGGNVSATQCTVSNCIQAAVDLNDLATPATFTNCNFMLNSRAVEGVRLDMVPRFVNCTASSNTIHDSLSLSSASLTANVSIGSQNMISNVILSSININVAPGAVLTLGSGVIVKAATVDLTYAINGSLVTNGTPGAPVVFTSIEDDAHGGDSNKNGASSISPNYWRGLSFQTGSGPSTLTNTRIRGGGRNFASAVEVVGANLTMTSCVVDFSQVAALDLNNVPSTVNISATAFNSSSRAVEGVSFQTLQGFHNNTAAGNVIHDSIAVTQASITGNPVITSSNMLNGCVLIPQNLTLPAGSNLTIEQGVVMKATTVDLQHTIDGTLTCLGTSQNPVVFTTIDDDAFAGDTGKNGPTSVVSNFWRGLNFSSTSGASFVRGTHIRGGGRNFASALTVSSNMTMQGGTVDFSQTTGLLLPVPSAQPRIRDVHFEHCVQSAISSTTFASLCNLVDNTATQNGGNYVVVTSGVVGTDDHVFGRNAPGGVVAIVTNPSIPSGTSLTLHQGVVIKHFVVDINWTVDGTLNLLGTAFEPVVLTISSDDTFGGDSDNNGATGPSANFWRGVTYTASAATSTIDHAWLRGGGRNFVDSFTCNSPNLSINALRVDNGQRTGMVLSNAAGDVTNCIVSGQVNSGIVLTGGTFDLVHATVTGCVQNGIERSGTAWTGAVRNSISRGNVTANFAGAFTTMNLMFSDGSPALAGMAGNIDADPMFVNAAAGDLTLQPGSPCIDAADPTLGFQLITDWNEGSRRLDANLIGTLLPDMGAIERTNWSLFVQGESRTAATQTFTLSGSSFGLGFLIVGTGGFADFFNGYGFLTIGHRTTVLPISAVTTDMPFPVSIPGVPALDGFHYEIQGLVVSPLNTTRGNFTERYRATIFD